MIKQKVKNHQDNIFYTKLSDLIDQKHELCLLSQRIPWEQFETDLSKYYTKDFGRPAKEIRKMVSLLILKQIEACSDEGATRRWRENPYWQYFSGEEYFQWKEPCVPTELTKFRNRIGEKGVEKILEISIKLFGNRAMEEEVVADTTVQEKNITFPTDTKLQLKVIGKCLKISKREGIKLRQSYRRTIKKLRWQVRYLKTAKRASQGRRAMRKIKTIAGRQLRDLMRKLTEEAKKRYEEELEIMNKVLQQKKEDKNKIYSLHEPQVSCISKGKEHKKYEFGSKASLLVTKTSGIIVGAASFQGSPYDGNTLEEQLKQSERIRGIKAAKALVDEGYRGRSTIEDTEVIRVHQLNKKKKYSDRRWKAWFRRRASIEAIISHLKNDYGLRKNYLKGSVGDSINLMLTGAAYNFRKLMYELSIILRFLKESFCLYFTIKIAYNLEK
jgi:IS5 family transposase